MAGICRQAWNGGLKYNILIECARTGNHTGRHQNAAKDMSWTGKLSGEESKIAFQLRELQQLGEVPDAFGRD